MSDTSPVGHEGNPKEDSITVSGGSVLSTATLTVISPFVPIVPIVPPPIIPPPPSGGGDDCTRLQLSVADQTAIEQCYVDEACGGDPDCEESCNNYYGAFRFGLGATDVNSLMPSYYVASRWLRPKGSVILNSTCPGLISRELRFDFRVPVTQGVEVYNDLTPATFQQDAIDNWDTLKGVAKENLSQGGLFDCRFINTAGSYYFSTVSADFAGEFNTGVAGVALLTDAGTGPTITGHGLIVDRRNNTAKLVQWTDDAVDNFNELAFISYVPVIGDQLSLDAEMDCACPRADSNPLYPISGRIHVSISGGTTWTFFTNAGSLTPLQYQSLRYGALLAGTVSNGVDLNLLAFRRAYTRFSPVNTGC